MRRRGGPVAIGWLSLAIWATWLFALQGRAASAAPGPPVWLPEVGVLLFVSLAPYLVRSDVLLAGALIACARSALSIDPPVAILAGYVGIAIAARGVRRLLALEGFLVRSAFALVASLALCAWLALAHRARATHGPGSAGPLLFDWGSAFATAAWVALLAPLFAHLPGLTPLRQRRTWPTAVSFT